MEEVVSTVKEGILYTVYTVNWKIHSNIYNFLGINARYGNLVTSIFNIKDNVSRVLTTLFESIYITTPLE